jgi:hypothetical protein
MKIAMTNCYFCEKPMPMGAAICPNCGRLQQGGGTADPYQRRMLIAIVLAVAALIAWHWFRS